jgi:hypothetical protein
MSFIATVGLAAFVILAMFGAYLWGYRDGAHDCMAQIEAYRESLKRLKKP